MIRALIVAAVLIPRIATAEPTPTVNWLMGEPMSLFDWGVYKTDKRLGELRAFKNVFTSTFMTGSAEYEWRSNRLRLRVLLEGQGTDAECTENLAKAKGAFLNYEWDPLRQVEVAPTVFADLFSHEGGYKSKTTPADLGTQLARIATIEVSILAPGNDQVLRRRVRCHADFTSSKSYLTRE